MRIFQKFLPGSHPWVGEVFEKEWEGTFIVAKGQKFQWDEVEGIIAREDGVKRGLITYKIQGDELEIVTLNSFNKRQGIGTALIAKVIEEAKSWGLKRVYVVTTNNNKDAIHFYERRGFRIHKVYPDALVVSRKLKPSIPLRDAQGIPIKDEVELAIIL